MVARHSTREVAADKPTSTRYQYFHSEVSLKREKKGIKPKVVSDRNNARIRCGALARQ